MSINVNVTGNPVRIHRGKMVTANPDYAKEEFQKRRRMRMQQVRQQSKDIAETVRNKVRKEQNRHLSDMERRGQKELKKWQARKLLQLQQQYDECLKDIGLGHSEATEEEETDYIQESRKESYDEAAKERGYRAAENLRHEKNQILINKEAGLHKRNYNHAIENTRAKLIANLNNKVTSKSPFKKTKRKVYSDLNRLSGGSDSGSDVPEFVDICSPSCDSSPKQPLKRSIRKDSFDISLASDEIDRQAFAGKSKKGNTYGCGQKLDRKGKLYSTDTRISDRIKSRTIVNDSCEPYSGDIGVELSPSNPRKVRESVLIHSDEPSSRRDCPRQLTPPTSPKQKTGLRVQEESSCWAKGNGKSTGQYSKNCLDEIPKRPTITILTHSESSNQLNSCGQTSGNINKVQCYDHKHRFTKKFIPDPTNVQRIPEDSIEVCPSSRSDVECEKQMYKRDQEAQIRGQKALQKQKVHRDYKEMMQQLPALEKQQKIASIPSKQRVHIMSEDRLKHRDKIKQNRMEDAYEKLFPKTRIITIPPKNHCKPSNDTNVLPFQTIDVNDNQPELNVGSWDVDTEPKCLSKFCTEPIQLQCSSGSILDQQKEGVKSTENLQDMLIRLQRQRNKLVKELSLLPESNNCRKLFGELGEMDNIIALGQNLDKVPSTSCETRESRTRTKHRSCKDLNKDNVSHSSGSPNRLETVREEQERRADGKIVSKYHTRCTPGSSTSPSSPPPPKIVNKAKRKVTQHPLTSTNTDALTTCKDKKSEEPVNERDKQKLRTPCDRCLHPGTTNELCEIIIKIGEKGKPEITVDPHKAEDVVIQVNEDDPAKSKDIINSKKDKDEVSLDRSSSPSDHYSEKLVPKKKRKSSKTKRVSIQEVNKKQGKQNLPDSKGTEVTDINEVEMPNCRDKNVPNCRDKNVPNCRDKNVPNCRDKNVTDTRRKSTEDQDQTQKTCTSWREYLSQNSSSTSYMSPPDFTSTQAVCTDNSQLRQQPIGNCMNILRDKAQQINIQKKTNCTSTSTARLNSFSEPNLLCFIKRLLIMSRKNIDDLSVSSGSDITTPSSSIINMQSNISTQQIDEFIKYFNINMSELQGYLNCSPGGSNIHNNTAESLSLSPTINESSSPNCTNICGTNTQDSKYNQYVRQTYPGVLVTYNKLAENCAKKIENLAAMIEKVRLDKMKMLECSESGSDKENSTKYLDLPPKLRKEYCDMSSSLSPNSLLEQEELNRQLLEVNPSSARHVNCISNNSSPKSDQHRDSINEELMERYKNLRDEVATNAVCDENCPGPPSTMEDENPNLPFVPLLQDIPRLPKLQIPSMTMDLNRNNSKSKPPTSKGICAARRFNNDVDMVPHELSTIAESESLISARLQKSKAAESQASCECDSPGKKSSSPRRNITRCEPYSTETSSDSLTSLPDILVELMNNLSNQAVITAHKSGATSPKKKKPSCFQPSPVEAQSESSSDFENMETMLKSLGMGWAITTLRKTQEALALTSSSSSIDINLTQKELKLSDSSTASELSIREKQLLAKLSSPNNSSGGSYQFLKDLSAIYGAEVCQERTTQRTSTPIHSSRSGDKSKSDRQSTPAAERSEVQRTCGTGESEKSFRKYKTTHDCYEPFYSLNESSSFRSKNE